MNEQDQTFWSRTRSTGTKPLGPRHLLKGLHDITGSSPPTNAATFQLRRSERVNDAKNHDRD